MNLPEHPCCLNCKFGPYGPATERSAWWCEPLSSLVWSHWWRTLPDECQSYQPGPPGEAEQYAGLPWETAACPFCGAAPYQLRIVADRVHCRACGCYGPTANERSSGQTREAVILKRWNRRERPWFPKDPEP